MTTLQEQLGRLAERGPILEPTFVVRRAVETAAVDARSDHSAAGGSSMAFRRLRVDNDDPAPERSHRSRTPVMVAAVAIAVAGTVGTFYVRSGVESPAGGSTPVAPATPAESAAPAVTAERSSSTTPGSDEPPALADDAMLLAMVYSLVGVSTPAETVTFLSFNIPEAEVASCMHVAGYEYIEGPSPADEVAVNPRMTMSAEDFATTYGLGFASEKLGLLDLTVVDPNLDYRSSLTGAERDAYTRTYAECSGRTRERIHYTTALNAAVSGFTDRLAADDRVSGALDAWRACMAAAGLDYDDPQSMRESFNDRVNLGSPTHDELQQLLTEEIAVAVANVPCEAAYTAAYRDTVTTRFREFHDLLDTALVNPGS